MKRTFLFIFCIIFSPLAWTQSPLDIQKGIDSVHPISPSIYMPLNLIEQQSNEVQSRSYIPEDPPFTNNPILDYTIKVDLTIASIENRYTYIYVTAL
jgi:hypothetical protein